MPVSNSADRRTETQDRPVLFQQFFKSGSRTYAAQVKQASNGKPFLVLTEGKRDPKTDEVKKSKLFVLSDDLTEFFHLLQDTATFLRPLRQQMKGVIPLASPAAPPASPQPTLQPPPIATRPPMPRPAAAPTNGKGTNGKVIAPSRPTVQPSAIVMKPPVPRPTSAPSNGQGNNGNGKAITRPTAPPARAVAAVRAMPPRPVPTRPMSRPVAAGRPSAASRESAQKTGRAR